ncbi:hypothetical protein SCUCBS95973_001465 [Sporothrix curviconia]|uniref:Uncharacterized protein n=1 Tax=Sporothrix curviconia TaxID=1260050 RepID=A0ABP0AYT7_9PEZI
MAFQELLSSSPATGSILYTPQSDWNADIFERHDPFVCQNDPTERPSTPDNLPHLIAHSPRRKRTRTGRFVPDGDLFEAPPAGLGVLFRNAQEKIMALHQNSIADPEMNSFTDLLDQDFWTDPQDMMALPMAVSAPFPLQPAQGVNFGSNIDS